MPYKPEIPSLHASRIYLRRLVVLVLVLLAGNCAVNFWFLFISESFHNTRIFHHRLAKVERNYELVFVGDSSLGNAIDEELFTELSGLRTGNLALTGFYGYAGSYNMLRRALEANPDLKVLVVMQAIDMMTRSIAYNGYLYTFNDKSDLLDIPKAKQVAMLSEFLNMIFSIKNFEMSIMSWLRLIQRHIVDDYIEQHEPFDINTPPESEYIQTESINPEKIWFLRRIVAYARNKGIRVIYIHGPIWEPVLLGSKNYVEEINRLISSTGINLIEEVVPIESSELGDDVDHVASRYKRKITGQFFDHLRSRLNN